MRGWLPAVLQSVEPYMSVEDISKGARWGSDIAAELEASHFGILCLTPDNLTSPWIHFEAGALSKSVDGARVSPFLLGLSPSQVTGPLVQFQATEANRDDVLRLVLAINAASGEESIDHQRIERVFAAMWPQLESSLEELRSELLASSDAPPVRDAGEILEELLELVRSQSRMLSEITSPAPHILRADGYTRLISVVTNELLDPENRLALPTLMTALDQLDPRLRGVIDLRFGMDGGGLRTLEEVGSTLGLTRERVRQLEARAIRKLIDNVADARTTGKGRD